MFIFEPNPNHKPMKKYGVVFLFLCITTAQAFAQNVELKAHYSRATLNLPPTEDWYYENGSHYVLRQEWKATNAFGVSVLVGNRFYVEPGINFSFFKQKADLSPEGLDYDFEGAVKLSVISVPIKVGYYILNPQENNKISLRIFSGIEGLQITKTTREPESYLIEISEDDFYPMVLNGDIGLGFDFSFFFIETGYTFGLTPFYKGYSSTIYGSYFEIVKVSSFYGTIGVRFSL